METAARGAVAMEGQQGGSTLKAQFRGGGRGVTKLAKRGGLPAFCHCTGLGIAGPRIHEASGELLSAAFSCSKSTWHAHMMGMSCGEGLLLFGPRCPRWVLQCLRATGHFGDVRTCSWVLNR